jgi:hypothetical protein
MKPYSVIVFLALLLTVQGSINDTTSAGFGSNIISGFNRLMNRITGRNDTTANVTTENVTRTNSTELPPGISCPPPTPDKEVF